MWCDILDVRDDHVVIVNIDLHVDGTATGRSHRVVFKLTFVFADAFTILLGCSFSSNSRSSTTTPMATRRWRSWCDAGDKKIVPVLWWWRSRSTRWWPYHVTYELHVMLILFLHLILLRTTVALWGDLSLKFQDEIVFFPTVHRCYSSSFRDTTWWSGVIDSTFTYNGCKTVAHAEHSG